MSPDSLHRLHGGKVTPMHLSMSTRHLPDDDWIEPSYRNAETTSTALLVTIISVSLLPSRDMCSQSVIASL